MAFTKADFTLAFQDAIVQAAVKAQMVTDQQTAVYLAGNVTQAASAAAAAQNATFAATLMALSSKSVSHSRMLLLAGRV